MFSSDSENSPVGVGGKTRFVVDFAIDDRASPVPVVPRRHGREDIAPMGYLLQGRYVGSRPGLTDRNSGAHTPLSTAFPACPRDWRWLGQRAIPAYDLPLPARELVVRPHPHADGTVLTDVASWSGVWRIAKGWAMWRAVAPPGYVALGDVFHYGYPPDREETFRSYACIRQDCVRAVRPGPLLWTSHGTGARDHASMWSVPDGIGDPWQRFRVRPGFGPPPRPVYVLDLDVVEVVSG